MNKTINKYILCEFFPPFSGGLIIFSFILLMDKVIRLIDLLLTKGIGISKLVSLLLYLAPPLLSFAIPISILFATLMTFGRLASDNEAVAFLSCGIHPFRLILPILCFAFFAFLLCLWLEISIIPLANSAFKKILVSVQQEKTFLLLNEGTFQELERDLVFFVKKSKDADNRNANFEGILIADDNMTGQSRIVIARQGNIALNKKGGSLLITLIDGTIHNLDLEGKNIYEIIKFGQYNIDLTISALKTALNSKRKYKELSQAELSSFSESDAITFTEQVKYHLEWHRRYAFPLACLIFALIGSLIGMLSKWSGKGSSFAVSLVLMLFYYFIVIAGYRLSMAGFLPPLLSAWLPNMIFITICIGGFRKIV